MKNAAKSLLLAAGRLQYGRSVCTRSYSSSAALSMGYKEPPYMVMPELDEDEGDPEAFKEVRVIWLSPKKKSQIWDLHKSDPETNNSIALARQFGVREERIKAILVLQRKREEHMRDSGVLKPENIALYDEYVKLLSEYSVKLEKAKAELMADGARCFKCGAKIYAGHAGFKAHAQECPCADGEPSAEGIAARERYNAVFHPNGWEKKSNKAKTGVTEVDANKWVRKEPSNVSPGPEPLNEAVVGQTAATLNRPEDEARAILQEQSLHHYMLKVEQEENEAMQAMMDEYVSAGAVVGETAVSNNFVSVTEDYYPQLFGDDEGFEEYRADLIRRIKEETNAETDVAGATTPTFFSITDRLAQAPADSDNTAKVPVGELGRWKWAFRDLSKKNIQPTMIRTRRGAWRVATPLEESKRSWIRNPTDVELEVYHNRVKEWMDPDADEADARQLVLNKTANRKVKLADAAGA